MVAFYSIFYYNRSYWKLIKILWDYTSFFKALEGAFIIVFRKFQEIFDDQDVTNFDKYFYKAGVMDWVQSQVLRIYNCSTLNVDLKTGKNTISQLLAQKMLIIEDVAQLILTSFTVGAPYNADDTVSRFIIYKNLHSTFLAKFFTY